MFVLDTPDIFEGTDRENYQFLRIGKKWLNKEGNPDSRYADLKFQIPNRMMCKIKNDITLLLIKRFCFKCIRYRELTPKQGDITFMWY